MSVLHYFINYKFKNPSTPYLKCLTTPHHHCISVYIYNIRKDTILIVSFQIYIYFNTFIKGSTQKLIYLNFHARVRLSSNLKCEY